MNRLRLAMLATALLLGSALGAAAQETIVGAACVVDGQTLFVGGAREQGRCHGGVKVRLYGIGAPDPEQRCATAMASTYACGISALNALEELTWRRTLQCEPMAKAGRDRAVPAICIGAEENLNAAMVRKGWAVADRREAEDFAMEEEEAKAALRGLWAGRFDLPWQWKRERQR